MERRYFLPDRVTQSGSQKCTGSGYKNAKNRYPQKTSLPAECILKIHSPHSRDFSRELGGWTLLRLRKLFYALMTKKCYPQKYRLETCSILTV